jgi:hypothetical protein
LKIGDGLLSRSFEYFTLFRLFFLVIIAAIIRRAKGKEVEESPLLPWHSGRRLDALAFGTSTCVLVPKFSHNLSS